jgi:hypothetical protein
MSIWVRSQDKTVLVKARWFVIIPKVISQPWSTTGEIDGFEIRSDCGVAQDGSFFMGKYQKKKEALKVLDMIQEHIESPNTIDKQIAVFTGDYKQIFQMPEAGFSQGEGEVRI